ncbi:hypothetical protein [Vibrio parahaemolyticus]|uniref:hypothetical protein n=1 Tax=Vibrio parahaemolyticus TaxID=670 RepID=UPI00186A6F73|nr:hypothetical protein [Vibrio parahaemolyticus]MBE4164603.1 hypothetical protein [Vibrio parahaemolyticus]MDG2814941.1 hypothetical protein [Vibrio parahaemolyticus]
MLYPEVKNYGDFEVESFESYLKRLPKDLSAIPPNVIEQWVYRHWDDFKAWIDLKPHLWSYELCEFTNEEIMGIGHVDDWIEQLDAEGVEYVTGLPRSQAFVGNYMTNSGSFPEPIIVAKDSGHVVHPKSFGENMVAPLQLIEGHSRLACIRGMITVNHESLKEIHSVWVVIIPKEIT